MGVGGCQPVAEWEQGGVDLRIVGELLNGAVGIPYGTEIGPWVISKETRDGDTGVTDGDKPGPAIILEGSGGSQWVVEANDVTALIVAPGALVTVCVSYARQILVVIIDELHRCSNWIRYRDEQAIWSVREDRRTPEG